MSKLCALIGHRRHRGRARPYLETWRSECVRCRIPMVRSAPGLWTTAPKLVGFLGTSSFQANPDGLPFVKQDGKAREGLETTGSAPNNHAAFPHEFATRILTARSAANDRPEHYNARSAECRRLAAKATDRAIELIHLDMATRYDILARQADDEPHYIHSVK